MARALRTTIGHTLRTPRKRGCEYWWRTTPHLPRSAASSSAGSPGVVESSAAAANKRRTLGSSAGTDLRKAGGGEGGGKPASSCAARKRTRVGRRSPRVYLVTWARRIQDDLASQTRTTGGADGASRTWAMEAVQYNSGAPLGPGDPSRHKPQRRQANERQRAHAATSDAPVL